MSRGFLVALMVYALTQLLLALMDLAESLRAMP